MNIYYQKHHNIHKTHKACKKKIKIDRFVNYNRCSLNNVITIDINK